MLSLETMADKSHTTPDGLFALPDHRLMTLSGRDALTFAQAQFMNDVTLLTDGQWQWNGWLTPKGRVIALFALLRVDGETLWLVLPDADPGELAAALKRYVFRSKVAIAVRGDLHVAGRLGAPSVAVGATAASLPSLVGSASAAANTGTVAGAGSEMAQTSATYSADPAAKEESAQLELDMSGDGGPRALYVLSHAQTPSPALEAAWKAADVHHGLPRLPKSQVEHWTPQQLSLERLKAFSVKKGCYPGQEIVARTHFLGKVKRGLMLVSASSPLEVGVELLADGNALGSVVSSAADDTGAIGLAVVPLERDAAAVLAVGEVPVTETSLFGGFAR